MKQLMKQLMKDCACFGAVTAEFIATVTPVLVRVLLPLALFVALIYGAWFFITQEEAEANLPEPQKAFECSEENIAWYENVQTYASNVRHMRKPLTNEELDMLKYYVSGSGRQSLEESQLMWTAHSAVAYMFEAKPEVVFVLLFHRECLIQIGAIDRKVFGELMAGFYKT